MIVSSALMIWKGLMVVSGSESPIVVVLSGSMEPAFHRGDLLFLTNYPDEPVRVGEIVVFKVDGRDIPIVHRVLKLHEKYVRCVFKCVLCSKSSFLSGITELWSFWPKAIIIVLMTGVYMPPGSCGWPKTTLLAEQGDFCRTSAWLRYWWTNIPSLRCVTAVIWVWNKLFGNWMFFVRLKCIFSCSMRS